MRLQPERVLQILIWGSLVLASFLGVLVVLGAWIQYQQDRLNRRRIERFQAWEGDLARYLFSAEGEPRPFPEIAPQDKRLFQRFLARY
ncbi:MAG TPA: hypothetical protein VK150_00780, partial [Geothrix sp.]|nr:hypothetical protein [Geothrix sp.]